MNTISFMTANYVARELDFNMTGDWGQGERATNAYFAPLDTYAARFGQLLQDIRDLGFTALDLWMAHLNFTWAIDDHLAIARGLLAQHQFQVVSLAGGFGKTPEEVARTCQIAVAVGAPVLGGATGLLTSDRAALLDLLNHYDRRLAIENHPEKTPAEMLAKIGDGGGGRIGTAVDTGWYGTQGFDAARALLDLRDYLFHVHLKDVRAPGAHDTCRFGQGCVPVEACVRMLQQLDYQGAISIEHEPEHFDPGDDCRVGLALVREWLSEPPGDEPVR